MKDTFDVYEWNKNRYLNENLEETEKSIQQLYSSVTSKLNDEELEYFHKATSAAFKIPSNYLNQD
jgi:hypothetical protein